MLVNTENLKTVQNFAREYQYSTVYIYRLIKQKYLPSIEIDGVKFIDVENLPDEFKKKK